MTRIATPIAGPTDTSWKKILSDIDNVTTNKHTTPFDVDSVLAGTGNVVPVKLDVGGFTFVVPRMALTLSSGNLTTFDHLTPARVILYGRKGEDWMILPDSDAVPHDILRLSTHDNMVNYIPQGSSTQTYYTDFYRAIETSSHAAGVTEGVYEVDTRGCQEIIAALDFAFTDVLGLSQIADAWLEITRY